MNLVLLYMFSLWYLLLVVLQTTVSREILEGFEDVFYIYVWIRNICVVSCPIYHLQHCYEIRIDIMFSVNKSQVLEIISYFPYIYAGFIICLLSR